MTLSSPAGLWLRSLPRNAEVRLRLFCFPYAGGGASIFRTWSATLPPEIGVYPVQLPGRENRIAEPAFTSIAALVAALVPVIAPYLDRPVAFFGHSMGSLISFELARALRRAGLPAPQQLFVSGHNAPQIPRTRPPLCHLAEPEFLAGVLGLGGTAAEVLQHPELRPLLLPLLRADFTAAETYTYTAEAPLAIPITVFGGRHDPYTTPQHLAAWQDQTHAACRVYVLPGDHFFLRPAQQELVQIIANHC